MTRLRWALFPETMQRLTIAAYDSGYLAGFEDCERLHADDDYAIRLYDYQATDDGS